MLYRDAGLDDFADTNGVVEINTMARTATSSQVQVRWIFTGSPKERPDLSAIRS